MLIIVKSALTVIVHWFATRRFAQYELEIGDRMFKAYINSSWEERSKRSVAEITRIADSGIANTMAGFILPLMRVPSSALTFVLIIAVLFAANPMTSIIALVYLTLIAVVVHLVVTKRALEAAQVNLTYSYRVAILMTEMIEALKELSLRNRLSEVADLVTTNRHRSVRARANGSFLGVVPRLRVRGRPDRRRDPHRRLRLRAGRSCRRALLGRALRGDGFPAHPGDQRHSGRTRAGGRQHPPRRRTSSAISRRRKRT